MADFCFFRQPRCLFRQLKAYFSNTARFWANRSRFFPHRFLFFRLAKCGTSIFFLQHVICPLCRVRCTCPSIGPTVSRFYIEAIHCTLPMVVFNAELFGHNTFPTAESDATRRHVLPQASAIASACVLTISERASVDCLPKAPRGPSLSAPRGLCAKR